MLIKRLINNEDQLEFVSLVIQINKINFIFIDI